ncbi:MAG TPA: hypothetical protein ENI68_09970 [Gammaproteobacteria bacterium]|nr:hypothetical protein [Gammaproteobacteria bacterium]
MNFEIEPIPEDADDSLAASHADLQRIVSSLQVKASAIQGSYNRTPIQRDVDLDSCRRDAIAKLDQVTRSLKVDQDHFASRRRTLRVSLATGDRLARYQEMRSVLRGLTGPKRDAALQLAIEGKDELVLHAVIDGAASLCGLNSKEYAAYTEQAREVLYGTELLEIENAEALLDAIAQQVDRGSTFIETFGKETLAHAV